MSYTPWLARSGSSKENSSYFESQEAKAKGKYCEKLSCVGLSIQDYPYLPKHDATTGRTEIKYFGFKVSSEAISKYLANCNKIFHSPRLPKRMHG